MTNVNNKLSICIPTFNRAIELENNILNLIPLCKEYNIEIIISDNNSIDSTNEVVNRYTGKYENIKYFKLDINRGIDYNINNVITKANSEYCWILGDDDFVFDGALNTILSYLNEFNPDFLLLNCEERDILSNDILKPYFFNLKNEYELIGPEILMEKFSGIMTLLSACVVKRENWEKVRLIDYSYKYYFHMYNVFSSLNSDSSIIVLNKPMFVRYAGNLWKFDRSDFDDILHYYYPMTIESSKGEYSFNAQLCGIKMKINKVNIGTFLRLRGKSLCSFSIFPKSYFVLMRHHLVLAFLALFIPVSINIIIYNIGKNLLRRDE